MQLILLDEDQRRIRRRVEYETGDNIFELQKNFTIGLLSKGIAKEQARAVLPEGNTLSRLYVNGTLRSWIHYIELRGANGTQLEHMELAWAVADAIVKIFPMAEEFKGTTYKSLFSKSVFYLTLVQIHCIITTVLTYR